MSVVKLFGLSPSSAVHPLWYHSQASHPHFHSSLICGHQEYLMFQGLLVDKME